MFFLLIDDVRSYSRFLMLVNRIGPFGFAYVVLREFAERVGSRKMYKTV